jgi:hypothetical protein
MPTHKPKPAKELAYPNAQTDSAAKMKVKLTKDK